MTDRKLLELAACATHGETARVVDNIHIGPVYVRCSCGPGFPVDEDGCCLMCGEASLRAAFETSMSGLRAYHAALEDSCRENC